MSRSHFNPAGLPALLALALAALPALLVACRAQAQISGDYLHDGHAYFIHGDTTVNGDISDNEVFVGKDTAFPFTTLDPVPPMTLSVTDGAKITRHGTLAGPFNDFQSYFGLNVFGHNIANISGGSVESSRGRDKGMINISGGSVSLAEGFDDSTVNISGGSVGSDAAQSFGTSTFNISGGTVGNFQAWEHSKVNLSGGSVQGLAGVDASRLTISGGTIGSGVIGLLHQSTATFLGSDLSFALLGTISDASGTYTAYSLSGALQDGQSLNGYTLRDVSLAGHFIGGGDTLTFVAGGIAGSAPEPGSCVLIVPGLLALVAGQAARHRRAA